MLICRVDGTGRRIAVLPACAYPVTDRDDLRAELDPATRERLYAARQQLHATVEALTGLQEALEPDCRRR